MIYKLTRGDAVIRLADGASIPNDPRNRDRQEYEKWLAAGNKPQPVDPETPAQTQKRLEAAVQAHLDDKARARGYDGIMSAATYATSTDVTFAAEGAGYRNFRDSAWRYCYTQLAAVQAGTRTAPTEAQLIAEIDANCPLVLP